MEAHYHVPMCLIVNALLIVNVFQVASNSRIHHDIMDWENTIDCSSLCHKNKATLYAWSDIRKFHALVSCHIAIGY